MTDVIRVLRILEYVGKRDVIEKTLSNSGVPMNGTMSAPDMRIKSAIVGDFPEILEAGPVIAISDVKSAQEYSSETIKEIISKGGII